MEHAMKVDGAVPKIVDRANFQSELDALRIREKAHTREGDALAGVRRTLPMVSVDGTAPLIGGNGTVSLLDAFEGRQMLIAYYFMWRTGQPASEQCEGCTFFTSRSASWPICIPVTSHMPRSARVPTKKAQNTAASWGGKCPGTRPRTRSTPSWLDARRASCTSFATFGKDPMSSRRTGRRCAASRRWTTAIGCST